LKDVLRPHDIEGRIGKGQAKDVALSELDIVETFLIGPFYRVVNVLRPDIDADNLRITMGGRQQPRHRPCTAPGIEDVRLRWNGDEAEMIGQTGECSLSFQALAFGRAVDRVGS
jgi:hypothetical protein